MNTIYNAIHNVILSGNYNADSLVEKIETFWVQDKLTGEERAELIQLAYENARDMNQVNVIAKLADLEQRVYTLEHANDEPGEQEEPAYPVYETGMIISKGDIVQFDYNNDGTMDLLKYDGGRATTTLSPGKISGWYVVDAEGNILGSYYKDEFTPVSQEEPAGE